MHLVPTRQPNGQRSVRTQRRPLGPLDRGNYKNCYKVVLGDLEAEPVGDSDGHVNDCEGARPATKSTAKKNGGDLKTGRGLRRPK